MIWTMVRHEWTLMRRQAMTRWAGGLLLIATVFALVGGVGWQRERLAEAEITAAESASILAEQRDAAASEPDGLMVGSVKTFVASPPGPLSALSVGVGDLYPQRAEISIWKRPDTLFGSYQLDSPLSLMVGRFDLGFVVLYLLPLFILAVSYDLLAAERERGSLGLLLLQPVSPIRLLASKLLARLLLVTACLSVMVAAAALAAGVSAASVPRLLGWWVVAWLYSTFWLAVSALVATLWRRSEACATALAMIWLLVVVVLPGALGLAVQAASPMPSRIDFTATVRAVSNEASKASAELLAQYYHEHPELTTNGQQGGFVPAFYASEREVERRVVPELTQFRQRMEEQRSLVDRWRYLSPAVLSQEAMLELSGSSPRRHLAYQDAVLSFLQTWHQSLAPKVFLGQALRSVDYDKLPRFQYAEPAVAGGRLLAAIAGLTVPTLLLLALACRRLRSTPALL